MLEKINQDLQEHNGRLYAGKNKSRFARTE